MGRARNWLARALLNLRQNKEEGKASKQGSRAPPRACPAACLATSSASRCSDNTHTQGQRKTERPHLHCRVLGRQLCLAVRHQLGDVTLDANKVGQPPRRVVDGGQRQIVDKRVARALVVLCVGGRRRVRGALPSSFPPLPSPRPSTPRPPPHAPSAAPPPAAQPASPRAAPLSWLGLCPRPAGTYACVCVGVWGRGA